MAELRTFRPLQDIYPEVGIDIPFGKGAKQKSRASLRGGIQTWDSEDRGQEPLPDYKGDPVGNALRKFQKRSVHGSCVFSDDDIKKGYHLMPVMGG